MGTAFTAYSLCPRQAVALSPVVPPQPCLASPIVLCVQLRPTLGLGPCGRPFAPRPPGPLCPWCSACLVSVPDLTFFTCRQDTAFFSLSSHCCWWETHLGEGKKQDGLDRTRLLPQTQMEADRWAVLREEEDTQSWSQQSHQQGPLAWALEMDTWQELLRGCGQAGPSGVPWAGQPWGQSEGLVWRGPWRRSRT